jgi:formylmethanofuran dehydrogenase subunit E
MVLGEHMIDQKSDWERCVSFHRHECPGLAIGYRAALSARDRVHLSFSADEDIVCITETDAWGVDAIQVLTGCSLGKGNLIYRNTGKQAFSFFNRTNGEKTRIVLKGDAMDAIQDWKELQSYIMNAPPEELFDFKEPTFEIPSNARIWTSIVCEKCGESAAEPSIRLHEGKKLCLDCFTEYSRRW